MKSYTLKSGKGNELNFTFNEANYLVEFKADASMELTALAWVLERLPVTYAELNNMATKCKYDLIEVQLDLSFEKFWDTYDYKVGNKSKCDKLWEGLTDADKSTALNKIPAYNRFLKIKCTDKIYPER